MASARSPQPDQPHKLTGVVPLLAAATAKTHLRTAAQEAFVEACASNAVAVALLLECDGVDVNAQVNPGYVRPTDRDDIYGYAVNDEGNDEGDTVLTRAARHGRSDVVRVLVGSGKADVNRAGPNGGLPLVLAIRSEDTTCVQVLLSAEGIDANAAVNPCYIEGDDADEEGDTILARAAREANAGAVQALVGSGKVDVNRAAPNGEPPLVLAMENGHGADAGCVEVLLAADGVDPNASSRDGWTALMAAACVSSTKWVRRLLETPGISVNHASESGLTALISAAQEGALDCVRALLEVGGIDANHADSRGATALYVAAMQGKLGCVRALLEFDGVDVTMAPEGTSPLIESVRHSWEFSVGCAHALVSAKGINLNYRRPHDGRTALHEACETKHPALASHLLTAGGCRFARNNYGNTPLDAALATAAPVLLPPMPPPGTTAAAYALTLASNNQKLARRWAENHAAIIRAFASGVDYWQRKLHGDHGWAMKDVVRTLLLVRQRLDARVRTALVPTAGALPHLPEEIWLVPLGFLRSADFDMA